MFVTHSVGKEKATTDLGSSWVMMVFEPIAVKGYLQAWQYRTSVQDKTCTSYASVWRLRSFSEFVKLQDSEIQLHPSAHESTFVYGKRVTDRIVRVKYGDVISAYVDKNDYELGCESLLFSSREAGLDEPTVLRLDNSPDHTITHIHIDLKNLNSSNFIHRAVDLRAIVLGKFSLS
jgi:hypothetical protein